MREHLQRATGCDLLITSAGVSVGEFDYTRDVIQALGAEMKFWRVPSGEVPRDEAAQIDWLYQWWQRIDDWVAGARV